MHLNLHFKIELVHLFKIFFSNIKPLTLTLIELSTLPIGLFLLFNDGENCKELIKSVNSKNLISFHFYW